MSVVIAAGLLFTCTPTLIADGDGPIHCAEGPKVRIAGVAARELDGSCRPGHPCPSASAADARSALAALLGGNRGYVRFHGNKYPHVRVSARPMTCRSTGSASGDRTGAFCTLSDGRDLSCTLIATGTVARWNRYWTTGRVCRSF